MLHFDEMMNMFTVYYINTLSWISIVLAQWNNSLQVNMSLHWDTLSIFRDKHSLVPLL